MRQIRKGDEPVALNRWKRLNSGKSYKDLSSDLRCAIGNACVKEQYYLCGYCCKRIDVDSSHNEHLIPQSADARRTLDFDNIIASCNTNKQCGKAHGSKNLTMTPLMPECETDLKYYISGVVEGLTDNARNMIDVLNLGDTRKRNRRLVEIRKYVIFSLLFQHGTHLEELQMLDADLIGLLIDEFQSPDNGKLEPYSPVIVSVLRDMQKAYGGIL